MLEAGDGVGGTWYWNRYPGARVDVQSIEYSFSFSKEIQDEWEWSELFSPQPEIESYLNWVTDRLDLRRDITFSTRVTAATYDADASTWTVETDTGEQIVAQFVVAATGCLSAPARAGDPGPALLRRHDAVHEPVPERGLRLHRLRVGVIGTGSSGVQSIPVIAEQAASLVVFQRSAAYSRPSNTRPFEPGEFEGMKANYDSIREQERNSAAGVICRARSRSSRPPRPATSSKPRWTSASPRSRNTAGWRQWPGPTCSPTRSERGGGRHLPRTGAPGRR